MEDENQISYIVYDYEEEQIEIPDIILGKKIMDSEAIKRVILSLQTEGNSVYKWRIEVIEFENIEAAKIIMAQEEMENILFARYQNIVYFLDLFASIFVHGYFYLKEGYCTDKDSEILFFPETEILALEELKIPDSFKYILPNAFNLTDPIKISKIICGEHMRRICDYALVGFEELKYFESNKNLISIGRGAFYNNPKLKTVILNDGLEYIDNKAFEECPSLEYVVIPASVKDIGYEAFTSGILYIEAEQKPEKWDQSFYGGTAKVYWGNEWEYNEEGIPVVIE